jgi:hypothetical protein
MTKKEENIIEAVLRIMKEQFDCKVLKNPSYRGRDLVDYRAIAMKLIRDTTNLSLTSIGQLWAGPKYKGKDHSSVLHNCKSADVLVKTDANFSQKYNKALEELRKIIPHLKPDQTIYQELTFLKAQNKKLIERDRERRDLMLKVHRGVLKIPHQYKEKIIGLFVAEKIYTPEDQNIFI